MLLDAVAAQGVVRIERSPDDFPNWRCCPAHFGQNIMRVGQGLKPRSEERRVGKECGARGLADSAKHMKDLADRIREAAPLRHREERESAKFEHSGVDRK